MSRLPVIAGFGGINPAGRSSGYRSFGRMVAEALPEAKRQETYLSLASLMGLVAYSEGRWSRPDGSSVDPQNLPSDLIALANEGTLLRRIESNHFDPDRVPCNKSLQLGAQEIRFELAQRDLPNELPKGWQVRDIAGGRVEVTLTEATEFFAPDRRKAAVSTAGQLPRGFDPAALYASNHHPRGLAMAVYGASDALGSSGFGADELKQYVKPDQIAIYSGAAMGQLDDMGLGGYMKAPYLGKRTSTKQMPFSLAEMSADFLNAYVFGSVGRTGGILGACASTLYNIDAAAQDIRSGRIRLALVGMAESPLVPEAMEGYRVMSALAEDDQILALDKHLGLTSPDHRRACRPFGYNAGFTMSESAQYFLIMDDELAAELGAVVYGAVAGVFVNADGIKKSITAPGVGNYLSIAQAAALGRSILGEAGLRHRTFVHAHGTGTPQNRVTESQGLNEVAKVFGIENWPIAAVKCYLGHSIGAASGDQVMAALGHWDEGILPGIFTLDQIADDVHHSHLSLSQAHRQLGVDSMDAALVNSKGFGGNNATGLILSPDLSRRMMAKKLGPTAFHAYLDKAVATAERAAAYDQAATQGLAKPIYRFGEPVLDGPDLDMNDQQIAVPGFKIPMDLNLANPFEDMTP
ncbi:MAG: beta-ketoacyl synthase [bacterium]|nr:beta-ketoacyl synthase [bacterium]